MRAIEQKHEPRTNRRFISRPTILLLIAVTWLLICGRTLLVEDVISFAIEPLGVNANVMSGRGCIVIWAWRHPGKYYPSLQWNYGLASRGSSYAERITGHRGWIWALIPLGGIRRGSMTITLPTLLLFLIFGIPGVWQLRVNRETRRRRLLAAGLCPKCEYDLRASAGRCPECGTVIASSAMMPMRDRDRY